MIRLPRMCKCDPIWNKGLHRCNFMKDRERIPFRIFRVGPKSRLRHRGTSNKKTEAETGVMCLQAKRHQGLLEAARSWRREGRSSPTSFRGNVALSPWLWTSGFRTLERIDFCCVEPPSVWLFFTTTLKTNTLSIHLRSPEKQTP